MYYLFLSLHQFSTFRSSAESFWALLFGDEILDVSDYIRPESFDHTQYFVFLMSRIILAVYGLLFPFMILIVVIAIITGAVEEKVVACIAYMHSDIVYC